MPQPFTVGCPQFNPIEIKRELLVGELSNIRAALLPVLAAIGGMVVPALIYMGLNWGHPTVNGWGIPMATDIAFAISVLVLLGNRIPPALVTFLIALAIVDDLGAVAVIALFYTDTIVFDALMAALAVWGILWLFNRAGIYRVWPYALGGVIMWSFMLASGIHATVAGVLTALAIPARPKIKPQYFDNVVEGLLDKFRKEPPKDELTLGETQKGVILAVHSTVIGVQPPSMRLEHVLHIPVALIVIPLFALANAGVHISSEALTGAFTHPVSLGIIAGLVLGKMIGIAGTAFLAMKLGIAPLPTGARVSQLIGIGLLGGIGFTMSIFIAELAWPGQPELLQQAKMGILLASLIAGISGYAWLRWVSR
jgi:NhaA family Na+:H+ antiporter